MKKIINLQSIFNVEFLMILKHVYKINPVLRKLFNINDLSNLIENFEHKSAKGVGKTYQDIQIILLLMLIDPHFSYIIVMDTKGENYKKVQRDFNRVLNNWEKFIPGISSLFDFYKSESRLSIKLNNGQWEQIIDFASVEEMGKGGWAPPKNTYYGGYMWDEAVLKSSASHSTFEQEELQLSLIRNWELSARRYLKDYGVPGFINFINYNPFVGASPVLEKINKKLPDNDKEQVLKLSRILEDYKSKTMFLISSLESNQFTNLNEILSVDRNIINWDTYLTEKYGLNSYGHDTILGHLWNKIQRKQDWINTIDRKEFIPLAVGIDVGSFGKNSAKTVMSLIAYHPVHHIFTVIEEFFYDPKKNISMTPDILARTMVVKLMEWEKTYPNLRFTNTNVFPIIIDPTDGGHSYFGNLMLQQYTLLLSNPNLAMDSVLNGKPLSKFEFILATEKWQKDWDGVERNAEWELMLGSGIFIPNKEWSPQLYRELPVLKVKNGKRHDIDIDAIQSVEYGLNEIMRKYFISHDISKFDRIEVKENISAFLKQRGYLGGDKNEK